MSNANTTLAGNNDRDIAIVGVSCRLPGGIADIDGLWEALINDRDLVGTLPLDRFDPDHFIHPDPKKPGKIYTNAGGFLDDIAGFDADFFGLSPREASRIDPQQRLLLELAVEALDDAGLDTALLSGSQTGVFVGISGTDYSQLQHCWPESITAYTNIGGALSIAANRISYVFDLRGPSMAIDTACSSTLVALHQACNSLRNSESTLALAAGVNIVLSPYPFIGFAKASMLSPTGRCHSFGAEADGYVRAEGGGVLILKRLAAALRDGDRIHAVVRGTGVNSDGRTVGLSLPNVHAQTALLREVYTAANIEADDLAYFEAHGTGTLVGDPVECQAIGTAIGMARRPGNALPIGSVKTNVGHLEPASGVAGLMKAILILRHGEIPASLGGAPANPNIDFAALNLSPVSKRVPLPQPDSAVIGVNSFGFGGTNAHAALSAAPKPVAPQPVSDGVRVVVVSAKSDIGLREVAAALARLTRVADNRSLYDIAFTSCLRSTRHNHRLAVIGRNGAEIADRLEAFQAGSLLPGIAVADTTRTGKVAFAFSGNGSQWAGMSVDLLDSEPAFLAAVDEVDALVRDHAGWSVIDELRAPASGSRLSRTEFAQPALFAVQIGLVALLRERGIQPQATFGHSVGEIAAAWAAGALDLATAVHVVLERSHAQASTAGDGRMAAVGLPAAEARTILAAYGDALELAAINSNTDVTIAGDADALARLREELEPRGAFFRLLDLDYAFHTARMDRIRPGLLASLESLRTGANACTFVSTVTGSSIDAGELQASYWWRNIRQPVLFAEATSCLLADGFDVFVEIGPHSVLSGYLRKQAGQASVTVIPTLKRDGAGSDDLDTAVASLIAAGAPVDWSAWFPTPGRVVALPAYPWQRERHWNGDASSWAHSAGSLSGGATPADHPLLGRRLPSLEPTWVSELSSAQMERYRDHRVGDSVVMPATGFVTLALEAGRRVLGEAVEIVGLEILKALVFHDSSTQQLQVSVSGEEGILRIASRADATAEWQVHARGRVQQRLRPAQPPIEIAAVRALLHTNVSSADHYKRLAAAGLPYGTDYQVIQSLAVASDTVLASYAISGGGADWEILPRLLDGGLQAAMPFAVQADPGALFLPAAIGKVQSWQTPALAGFALVRRQATSSREIVFSVSFLDGDGAIAVTLSECRLRRFESIRPLEVQRHAYVLRSAPDLQIAADTGPSISPATLAISLEGEVRASKIRWRTAHHYASYQPRVDALCGAFAGHALAAFFPADRPFGADDLLAAGVQSSHRRLLDALLQIAESDGYIAVAGTDRWKATTKKAEPDALFPSMVADFPEYNAELLLVGRCGLHLAEVLRGTVTGLELIFPERGAATEAIYDTAPAARFYNDVIRKVVCRLVADWPSGRPIRILEIGGGTGGVTASILPLLPPNCTNYTFTDLSEAFTLRAADRFREYDFMEFRRFDVERDPDSQGFTEGTFDLVIAANVLHATADLHRTLENAGRCLRPGGMLLALEKHEQRSLTMVFGTLSGLWLYTDTELRPRSAVLSAKQWPDVLAEAGFDEVALLNDAEPGISSQDSIILARQGVRSASAPVSLSGKPDDLWIIAAEPADEMPVIEELDRHLNNAGCLSVRCFSTESMVPEGDNVAVIEFDRAEEWLALVEAAGDAPGGVHIVLVLGTNVDERSAGTVARAMYMRAISGALSKLPSDIETHFWLITRPSGALPFPEAVDAPSHAAAWGLARSLANEVPNVKMRRISADLALAPTIARELVNPTDEDEVVLTRNGRFVSRLRELRAAAERNDVKVIDFALRLTNQGVAYRLPWVARTQPREAPRAGEVVIEVKAIGLNYRDVLWAMGILTDEAVADGFCGNQLGPECAGIVIEVGPDVRDFKPGDRVYAMARASFASHVVSPVGVVGHMPEAMTFAEAATLVTAFITVHYSLTTLGRLKPGETILIHGASGGVGLAAIQHAKAAGAIIIATAGTDEKRDYVRLLGADYVLNSRNLAFSETVMEITGGRGVDLILNSLAGEAILRNLEILRPFGRFIELGKRDFYANTRIGLRPFRNNISFFGVDIDQMIVRDPELARAEFAALVEHVNTGFYRPLPHRVYPAARVEEAFRLVQNSQHIGKVVISLDEAPPIEIHRPVPALDAAGTYVVVGGVSGFGAAAAVWLADRGARQIALVGRRGAAAPEVPETIARLAAKGATATAYAIDATDFGAMQSLFGGIDCSGAPVRGVIHAAMVLDDAALSDLTPDRFGAALAPKMATGQVLDRLTRQRTDPEHRIDLFVIFSSVTATFGIPGQTNYAAGNLYLEAMVRARRHAGLPGLAIAWGAIGEAGYLAREGRSDQICERLGVSPLSPQDAFAVLDDLLARNADVVAVGQYNWHRMQQILFSINSPRLAALKSASAGASEQDAEDLTQILHDLPPDEVLTVLEDMTARLLSEIFRTAPDRLDRNRSLQEMGMDSLMAVELQVVLERQFGCDIPVMEVVGTGGIRDLARLVATRLGLVVKAGLVTA